MKHLVIPIIGWLVFTMLPLEGWAQRYRNRNQAPEAYAYNSRNTTLDRDRQEIRRFQQSLTAYEEALRYRDGRNARMIRMDLESDMRREIRQNENKLYRRGRNVHSARSRTKRRPNGTYVGTGSNGARQRIVEAQESLFFNYSRTQVPGRGRAYGRYRKSVNYLYDFLDTMRDDLQVSRREINSSGYQAERSRNSRRW